MQHEHRKFLNAQLVVSAVLNSLISALFVWIVFGGLSRIGLWGTQGLALDLVPTTFMITLMTAIALTLVTRAAVQKGELPPLERRHALPRHVLLRAPLLALATTLILVPLSTLALAAVWRGDWSFTTVLIFKIVYGVVLGTIVTPIVVLYALRDGAGQAH